AHPADTLCPPLPPPNGHELNPRINEFLLFFFNDTAPTEIYTLPLHDPLPISRHSLGRPAAERSRRRSSPAIIRARSGQGRSEEHTSELQSQFHLVCRLLLEKNNQISVQSIESKSARPLKSVKLMRT